MGTSYRKIDVQPLTGALGAELLDVDLSRPLDDETFAEIERAWAEHLVVFFRDQNLTTDQHRAFTGRFGALIAHPFVTGMPDHPDVIEIVREPGEPYAWDSMFHADLMFLEEPPIGAALYGREVPPVGGDTMFVNMYLAYDTLSDGMKNLLHGLYGVNSSGDPNRWHRDYQSMHEKSAAEPGSALHPIVRVHPVTGKKSLYVSPGFTQRIDGMTEEESRPILEFLVQHALRPPFMCRFRWKPGSMALWDNRVTLHNGVADYYGEVDQYRRVVQRATIGGDRPIAA